MNAVRIRKHLDSLIPKLPELDAMLGRQVDIIILDDSPAASDPASNAPPSAESLGSPFSAAMPHCQGLKSVARFEDLLGGWPEDQLNDGFEEQVDRWRQGPWRADEKREIEIDSESDDGEAAR